MRKTAVLMFLAMFAACANPKPAVQSPAKTVPASNPYAGRPDLLKERQVVIQLVDLGNRTLAMCAAALRLVAEDKDAKHAALLKVAAHNFCAERFDEYAAVADQMKTRVNGEYLEAVILLKHVGKLHGKLAGVLANCATLEGEPAKKCESYSQALNLGAKVLSLEVGELLERIVGEQSEDGSSKKEHRQ